MIHQEAEFIGIDANTQPDRLPSGYFQQADNVVVDGGNFTTRPGIVGLLSAAMGGPIYALTEYRRIDNGHIVLIFAQGGKLWQWDATVNSGTGTAPTELKLTGGASFAFPNGGVTVRLTRFGKFLYGCDGQHPLFRVNLESGTTAYSAAMIAPQTPTVTLSNTTIDAGSNPAAWTGLPSPSNLNSLLLNGSFENGTSNGSGVLFPITSWNNQSSQTDARSNAADNNMTPPDGTYALRIDSNDATQQSITGLPTYNLSAFGLPNMTARVYAFQGLVHNSDTNGYSTIAATTQALNGSAAVMAQSVVTIAEPYSNLSTSSAWVNHAFGVSFNGLSTDPASLILNLASGIRNGVGQGSIYIDKVQLAAADMRFIVSKGTGAQPLLVSLNTTAFTAVPDAAQYVAGQWVCYQFGAATDLSVNSIISAGVNIPTTSYNAAGNAPSFRFGFMSATDTTIAWSNVCSYSDDGDTLYCDCSTVALESRQGCVRFFIGILDNLPNINPANVFSFGPLTGAGSLTLGDPYTYLTTEVQTISGAYPAGDIIESTGSTITAAVTITDTQAQTVLVIPKRANDGTNGRGLADHIPIWRQGGVLVDEQGNGSIYPFWRFVAAVPVGADATGPGWTWTYDRTGATAGTFRDNVPDSTLIAADTYEPNRDYFPTGAVDPTNPTAADPRGAISTLCVANGRLFAAAGNTIYASWLFAVDQEAGLYTSNVSDLDDPSVDIKGAMFPLGSGAESDTVVALVPLKTVIVAFRQDVISHIEGILPSNFATSDQYAQAGVGCIAPASAVVDAQGGTICYLATDGVRAYDQGEPKLVGEEIKKLLGIVSKTSTISASGPFTNATQLLHEGCRYLFVPGVPTDASLPPGTSQTQDAVAYVYDGDAEGFTRWILPSPVASAVHANGTAYLGGTDGQIYTLSTSGFQDYLTPTATPTPITMSLMTRAMGEIIPHPRSFQAQFVGQATEQSLHNEKPSRFHVEVTTAAAAVPLTLSLSGSFNPTNVWSQTYYTRTDGGETNDKVRVDSACGGNHLTLGLSATVTAALRIRRLAIESAQGRRR